MANLLQFTKFTEVFSLQNFFYHTLHTAYPLMFYPLISPFANVLPRQNFPTYGIHFVAFLNIKNNVGSEVWITTISILFTFCISLHNIFSIYRTAAIQTLKENWCHKDSCDIHICIRSHDYNNAQQDSVLRIYTEITIAHIHIRMTKFCSIHDFSLNHESFPLNFLNSLYHIIHTKIIPSARS